MKVNYENNETVKFLKSIGFSDDYIMKGIDSGDINLEKSEDRAARGDHESETKQEEDIDKLEREAVKKEKKVKRDEKDTAEDRDAEGIEKSDDDEDQEEMMKSVNATIQKSLSVFAPIIESLQKSVERMDQKLDKIGSSTPSFKSEGLNNFRAIEKAMNFEKDENDKYEVNIVTQRPMASKLIEKALDGADDIIRKSLQDDALAFLTNPEADVMGEDLARYMYEKNNVKFVK
jgi:hypothetical protein